MQHFRFTYIKRSLSFLTNFNSIGSSEQQKFNTLKDYVDCTLSKRNGVYIQGVKDCQVQQQTNDQGFYIYCVYFTLVINSATYKLYLNPKFLFKLNIKLN